MIPNVPSVMKRYPEEMICSTVPNAISPVSIDNISIHKHESFVVFMLFSTDETNHFKLKQAMRSVLNVTIQLYQLYPAPNGYVPHVYRNAPHVPRATQTLRYDFTTLKFTVD